MYGWFRSLSAAALDQIAAASAHRPAAYASAGLDVLVADADVGVGDHLEGARQAGHLFAVRLASIRGHRLSSEAERDRVVSFGMERHDGIDLVQHPVPVAGATRVLRHVPECRDFHRSAAELSSEVNDFALELDGQARIIEGDLE